VASAHMRARGRDPPVILGAQIVQLTESQILGSGQGVVNAAYFSPSAYAGVPAALEQKTTICCKHL
jgi:hypothetical protein